MSIFNDTNNSINEILQILKNYRTEGKQRQSFFHDGSLNTNHLPEQSSSFTHHQANPNPKDTLDMKLRLHTSLQSIPRRERMPSTIRYRQAPIQDTDNSIFSRLYQENKALRERRERLFKNGRKQNEDMQIKECTFSPNLKVKTEKCINQEEIQSFYQKNISWKNKVEKEVKLKQCEKNSEGINHLTFAPKINPFRKRENNTKENTQPLIQKKGVEEFLLRQQKAKNCIETLESRKKNAYSQIWTMKKCQFSYLH